MGATRLAAPSGVPAVLARVRVGKEDLEVAAVHLSCLLYTSDAADE